MPGQAEKVAEHLGITLDELFHTKLMVDFWVDEGDGEDTYVLSPAVKDGIPGKEFPYHPHGVCVFLKEGLCEIHPVKPAECADYVCGEKMELAFIRKRAIKEAWEEHQPQINELLGRSPELPITKLMDLLRIFDR